MTAAMASTQVPVTANGQDNTAASNAAMADAPTNNAQIAIAINAVNGGDIGNRDQVLPDMDFFTLNEPIAGVKLGAPAITTQIDVTKEHPLQYVWRIQEMSAAKPNYGKYDYGKSMR